LTSMVDILILKSMLKYQDIDSSFKALAQGNR
jgi:hypothetical protein